MPTRNRMTTSIQPMIASVIAGSPFQQHVPDDMRDSMLVVAQRNGVRRFLDRRLGIAHGDAESGLADRLDIVEAVSDSDGLGHLDAENAAQLADGGRLVHSGGIELEVPRRRVGDLHRAPALDLAADLLADGVVLGMVAEFEPVEIIVAVRRLDPLFLVEDALDGVSPEPGLRMLDGKPVQTLDLRGVHERPPVEHMGLAPDLASVHRNHRGVQPELLRERQSPLEAPSGGEADGYSRLHRPADPLRVLFAYRLLVRQQRPVHIEGKQFVISHMFLPARWCCLIFYHIGQGFQMRFSRLDSLYAQALRPRACLFWRICMVFWLRSRSSGARN
ncbi:hypothetical protein BN871_AY_00180 [Paenibacillus sp. P22]|nr:hypothetical protein BN871_AY_00180 [Paenibacillus sp. P22]